MSCPSELSCRSQSVSTASTVRRSVNAERSDLVVVGAGAAGLFACLCAAREGAAVTLVSARPLAETASYWAQGGLAAALTVDDSPAQHLEDTIKAGRGLVRRSAADVLTQEAPARFHDLEALGVRFDADRHGNVALGLEGGHSARRVVHAGGSATGRRILRQLSADVVEHPGIEILEGARAASLRRRRPRRGRPARGRPHADRARDDPRHRRRRRAVVAHHQPARLVRLRPAARPRRRRRARRPRVRPVPPNRRRRHQGPRGLPDHRGDPRRGSDAARRQRRALRRRARAARRGRPRDLPHAARAGHDRGQPGHAARRPGALPERRRRAARGRAGPGDRARPGRAREPLRDGRDRHRPRRPLRGAGAVRGRRVRLHRPARRQPARLQLAVGVLRVRAPRRAAGARRAAAARRDTADGRARSPPPRRARRARRCGATPASSATPTACARCSTTRTRSLGSSRQSALFREESRGAHARADFPATDPDLDERHTVIRRTGPQFEHWL